MQKWFDLKIAAIVAMLVSVQQGIKLSAIDWTFDDLLYAGVVVILGTLLWTAILPSLRRFLERKR